IAYLCPFFLRKISCRIASYLSAAESALQEAAIGGSSDPHFESENGLKKQRTHGGKAPPLPGQLTFLATTDLKLDPRNPRKHDRGQIRAIARSFEALGFIVTLA